MMNKPARHKNPMQQMLLMAGMAIALFALIRYLLPAMPSSPMMRDAFWASKALANKPCEIVYVGDSRVYRGVDPLAVGKQCRLMGYNYGYSSAGISPDYLAFASEALISNGRRVMFIGISPNEFMSSSVQNEHFHSVMNWTQTDKYIRANWYPVLKVFDNISFADMFKFAKGEKYFESYDLQTGFAASDRIPVDTNSALDAYKKQFDSEQWSEDAEETLIRFIAAHKESGIEFVVSRVPTSPSMKAMEDSFFENRLKNLFTRLASLGVRVFEYKGTDSIRSYDGSHLCAESAEKYSQELGAFLAK